ncbi:MAG TPA: MraY family glycosyltransferase [Caulobacteraceae bacterium]|nr:MraY family glycosyltransferase [Caulobacteraceae bacterium]
MKLITILGFAAAFLLTAALVLALRPIAARLGLLDHPGGRKDHATPTPVIGGLAIALGAAASIGLFGGPGTAGAPGLALACAALLLTVVGLIDDRYDVRWYWRLGAQAAAGLILVYVGGVRVEQIGPVFGLSPVSLGALSIPFTVLATVGLINALNMIDGVDGLAGLQVLAALAMLAAAALYAGNTPLSSVLIITGGAVAGFLAFNLRSPLRKRASVFLGNAGSAVLGLVIAWASFRLTQNPSHPVSPVLAPFLIALPVIDCLVLMVHRSRIHGRPFAADRTHVHHRMLDAGFKPGEVAVVLAVFSLIIGFGAGLVRLAHAPQPLFILAFLSAVAFYAWTTADEARAAILFRRLHAWLIEDRTSPPAPAPDLSAEDLRQAALRSVAKFKPPEPAPAAATSRVVLTEAEAAKDEARAVSL